MDRLFILDDYVSRSCSPENITGEKAKGGASQPNPDWPARNLGVGWKCSPYIEINSKQTSILADIKLYCVEKVGQQKCIITYA